MCDYWGVMKNLETGVCACVCVCVCVCGNVLPVVDC